MNAVPQPSLAIQPAHRSALDENVAFAEPAAAYTGLVSESEEAAKASIIIISDFV
jgi:hypothetical protein